MDPEDLVIWGDYNQDVAQQLAVKFKMCEGHEYCESKEDILKWISGKYVLLLYNQVRFNTEVYFQDAVVPVSVLKYIPISSQIRQIVPLEVQTTNLELQDYDSVNLDSITRLKFE